MTVSLSLSGWGGVRGGKKQGATQWMQSISYYYYYYYYYYYSGVYYTERSSKSGGIIA
jgi:hypothetical protein